MAKLAKSRGFTLVELLVVIAIIAVLVLILIIAIDPVQRLHDANDRNAASNVRSTASAVEACLIYVSDTGAQNTAALCDDSIATAPGFPWLKDAGSAANINAAAGGAICIWDTGGTGHEWSYIAVESGAATSTFEDTSAGGNCTI